LKIKSVLEFSTILFPQDFSRVIIFKSFYDTIQFYVQNLFYVYFFGIQTATTVAKPEREPKRKWLGWTLTCLCMTMTELSSNGGKSKPNSQPGHQARLYILNSQSQKGQLSFIVPCLTQSSLSWLVWFGCKSRDSLLLSLFFSFAKEMAKQSVRYVFSCSCWFWIVNAFWILLLPSCWQ